MRESFVFYRSWLEAIKNLPREVQGDVLTSIMEYGLYGETTEPLKPITKAMLEMVKPQIDKNNQRYENGCKGGRPRAEVKPKDNQKETKRKPKSNQKITKTEPDKNQEETKSEPNVYDNDNDNERDSLSLEKEKEKENYPDSFVPVSLKECYDEISQNASWAEMFVMNKRAAGYRKFTSIALRGYLDEFFRELQCRGETQKSVKDAMSHFAAWVNLKLEKHKDERAQNNSRIDATAGTESGGAAGSGLKIHRYSGA